MKKIKKMLRKAVSEAAALAVCAVGAGTLPAGVALADHKTPEIFADDMKIEDRAWFEEGDYAIYGHFDGASGEMYHLQKWSNCIIVDLGEDFDISSLESELREKVNENIEVTENRDYFIGVGNKIRVLPDFSVEEINYDNHVDMSETQAKEIFKILENYADNAEYHTGAFEYTIVSLHLDEYFENQKDTLEQYIRAKNIGAKIEPCENSLLSNMLKIVPDREFSSEDYIELAGDILESTGIRPPGMSPGIFSYDKGVSVSLADYTDGDANTDGQRTLADAVAILQSLANGDEYGLTLQGLFNADIFGNDGVNVDDALEIQRLATVEKSE